MNIVAKLYLEFSQLNNYLQKNFFWILLALLSEPHKIQILLDF